MSKHTVTFTAEDGWLRATCTCGWSNGWQPAEHIREGHYGIILATGLAHTRESDPKANP